MVVVTDVAVCQPLEYDASFRGPIKNRSCTDVICLLLFLVFLGAWAVVAVWAYKNGDPVKLLHPTDTVGDACGVGPLENRPVLFFFDLVKCADPLVPFTGCPTRQVCVERCPNETYNWDSYGRTAKDLICDYGVTPNEDNKAAYVKSRDCASYYLKSKELLGRCIPDLFEASTDIVKDNLNHDVVTAEAEKVTISNVEKALSQVADLLNAQNFVEQIFEDFKATWWVIVVGVTLAAILSLLWIVLLRCMAFIVVVASIVGAIAVLCYGLYASVMKYLELEHVPDSDKSITEIEFTTHVNPYLQLRQTWLIFIIIISIILFIILLILLFLRNRIRIAIALIEQGSKAVSSMMSTLAFPIVNYFLALLVLSWFLSVALYLSSISDPVYKVTDLPENANEVCSVGCQSYENNATCEPRVFMNKCNCTKDLEQESPRCQFFSHNSNEILSFHAFNIFGLFWGLFFVSAMGEMILAGAYASWYWTFHKEDLEALPLLNSFGRTLRYHTGTLAFGSLIIAIIRMIRVILEYIDRKLKKYDNEIVKAIMCCCKCCFWCLEKFMRFINRNAYIMCAVHGKNFCVSAKDSFFLLARNIVRVVVLDKVTDFLLFLGRLLIVGGVTALSYFVFSRRWDLVDDRLPMTHNYLVPVITTCIGSYFVASTFFNVYAMSVDTLFLCFLEDLERNDGSAEKPYFMSKDLMKILGKKNKVE